MRIISIVFIISIFLSQGFTAVAQEDDIQKWFGPSGELGFGKQILTGADFNADGLHDLVVLSLWPNSTSRIRTFTTQQASLNSITPSLEAWSIALTADRNSDGKMEIVAGSHPASCGTSTTPVVNIYAGGTNGTILNTLSGSSKSSFGDKVEVVGDKLIVTAPTESLKSPPPTYGLCDTGKGAFYVYSLSTLSLLYSVGGTYEGQRLGYSMGNVGDVNNDGSSDFVVVSLGGPSRVYSGAATSATALYDLPFNLSVATFEPFRDFNSDGYQDFLVGDEYKSSSSANSIGTVYVVSGEDGIVLSQLWGERAYSHFGTAIKKIGDLNSDGIVDFAVGAWGDGPASHAYVAYYSGADLARISINYEGYTDMPLLGGQYMSFASPGDITGDGKLDLLVGTFLDSSDPPPSNSGSIRISSASGCEWYRINSLANVCF